MAVDWLVEVLRAAGVPVAEYPGWRTRAAAGAFAPRAVMWHHDASAAGPSPGLPHTIAEVGNSTTPPPLAQAWVDMAGVWHVTAAGRANHAGIGSGWGRVPPNAGNQYAVGVETDHTVGEAWPMDQLGSLRAGTAAILRRLGAAAGDALCGHKEYTSRKVDPAGLDMTVERRVVADLMKGTTMSDLFDQATKNAYDQVHGAIYSGKAWEGSNLQKQLGYVVEQTRAVGDAVADLASEVAELKTQVAQLTGDGVVLRAAGEITVKAEPA